MRSRSEPPVETVNFHLWQPCNMRCAFCFGVFKDVRREVLPAGHLSQTGATEVVLLLARAGFEKITFAGGEPLLCPWLPDLVRIAKQAGMVTNVVTNGALLDTEFLDDTAGSLDWITLSVDSVNQTVLRNIGRTLAGNPMHERQYRSLSRMVKTAGVHLKINTVVNRANLQEDLSSFILDVQPQRWKILQALPIRGQNDRRIGTMAITAEEFHRYVQRHHHVTRVGIAMVSEDNEAMSGTYAMLDPAGRFVDNVDGTYRYTDSVLDCGVEKAIGQVRVSRQRFLARGGRYDW
ncbi:MAG TPA: viperin family antiviral radical SAM protein [Micromonosporaceae bacterium]